MSENTSRPIFIYDATGTTFNGVSGDTNTSQSDAIDLSSKFDVAAAGLLGNSNRTIMQQLIQILITEQPILWVMVVTPKINHL